jgi:hypothetical protein
MELMCQKVNVPGISVPDQTQPTILGTTIPVPSMTVQFEPLTVEFIVDSELNNWKSMFSWIRNITNIENTTSYNLDYQDWHHEATLSIFDAVDKCNPTVFRFFNIVPISLSGFSFQSDSADALLQKATCRFKYSYYTVTPNAPTNLKNTR